MKSNDFYIGILLLACIIFAVWRSYSNVKREFLGRKYTDRD